MPRLANARFKQLVRTEIGVAEGYILRSIRVQDQIGRNGYSIAFIQFFFLIHRRNHLIAAVRITQGQRGLNDLITHALVLSAWLDNALRALAFDIDVDLSEVADR